MRESPLYQEIAAEGAQEQARADVLEVLRARFGEAASEFVDALSRIDNMEQLRALIKIAAKVRRVSQFRRALTGS
jgi:hypothetical protein